MIRILHVVTHMNRGGLETMIMNYYRKIDRTQMQFDFLTHRDYDGDYGEEIKALGGIIYHLPVLNPFSKTYRKTLDKFFENHPEYDIVHVHQDCLSSIILKSAKKHHVKVRIAHSHNASQDKNIKYLLKLFYKKFITKYATDLLACGKDAGDWMFDGAPYQILNNAIDSSAYTYNQVKKTIMRKQLKVQDEEILIGHVGRFSPAKNHQFIVEVFNQLQKKTPAKLVLIGDGALKREIKAQVRTLGLSENVIFTGVRSDVADFMQAMDVFLFPSLYEGLPVTLVEAQASGLPCLISDNIPDDCKMTSLITSCSLAVDSDIWAEKLLEMAMNTNRKDMKRKIADAGFDISENAKWLQNYYIKKLKN